jgi:hypothetical protein
MSSALEMVWRVFWQGTDAVASGPYDPSHTLWGPMTEAAGTKAQPLVFLRSVYYMNCPVGHHCWDTNASLVFLNTWTECSGPQLCLLHSK